MGISMHWSQMKPLFFVLILINVVRTQYYCPENFNYNTDLDTCFSGWSYASTWTSATSTCSYYGANLLSIHNAFQNSLIAQIQFNQSGDYRGWLGVVPQTDSSWTDGTLFDYQRFQSSGHSGNCIYLDSKDQFWKAADCTVQLPFLCATTPLLLTTEVSTSTDPFPSDSTDSPNNLTCLPMDQQPLFNCQQGWQYFPQTGYQYLVIDGYDFASGEAECVSQRGHLASIHSQTESDFITSLCCPSSCDFTYRNEWYAQYLIGGFSQNGQQMWTDGTPFDYQPEQMCYGVGDTLVILNYGSCGGCPTPGIWDWGEDGDVSYAVCKK